MAPSPKEPLRHLSTAVQIQHGDDRLVGVAPERRLLASARLLLAAAEVEALGNPEGGRSTSEAMLLRIRSWIARRLASVLLSASGSLGACARWSWT